MSCQSPPHTTLVEDVIVNDVLKTAPQNINPLNAEDLKKILDQSTQQAKLCKNIVLVNVEEYQKVMNDTNVQPSIQKIVDTSTKVDAP